MKISRLLIVMLAAIASAAVSQAQDENALTSDSMEQVGVPKGEVSHHTWASKVFPGTVRDYWVYVPSQYDGSKPACTMVCQDGGGFQSRTGGFRLPVVLDNLIHKKEMPITIAIMINPGEVPANSPNAWPRYNRSYEYDAMTADYARFLETEILPEVGKKYKLTQDPNERIICGASSGGIASLVAAWERPDLFRRVVSFVGSFTNLRGGHMFPFLIRKFEPRPIRVFMQDGKNDQDIYSGSWFIGNNDVFAALNFGGYDVKYEVGNGGHNGSHGTAILPAALKWIWRDYPETIHTAKQTKQPILQVVNPRDAWIPILEDIGEAGGIAVDLSGAVYLSDIRKNQIVKISADGSRSTFQVDSRGAVGLAYGPDGRLYAACPRAKQVIAWDASGKLSTIIKGIAAKSLVLNHLGHIYLADDKGKIWFVGSDQHPKGTGMNLPGLECLALTPDQELLIATHNQPGRFAWSYHIDQGGLLNHQQPFFDVHIDYEQTFSGSKGMALDEQGRLFMATHAGIQVFDQPGRVIGMVRNPDQSHCQLVALGGEKRDQIFVVCGSKLYKRQTFVKGTLPHAGPIKGPQPRL